MNKHPWNTKNKADLLKTLEDWEEIKPSQYATLHGLSVPYVRKLCREGKIEGAYQMRCSKSWIIPYRVKVSSLIKGCPPSVPEDK